MSSSIEIFNEAASCKQSLASCGHKQKLTMQQKVCKANKIQENAKEILNGLIHLENIFSWLITITVMCHRSHHFLNCSHDFLDSCQHFSSLLDSCQHFSSLLDSCHHFSSLLDSCQHFSHSSLDFFETFRTTFVASSRRHFDSCKNLDSSHVLF